MADSSKIVVLYIPCGEPASLAVDLEEILRTIGGDFIRNLIWGVETLECVGPDAQDFCNKVEMAPGHRLLVSGDELLKLASTFVQVIEGVFIGYPIKADAETFLEHGWAKIRFTTSAAEIAIEAIDGCGFDVYLHSQTCA